MKTLQILFVMLGLCISNLAQAQKKDSTKTDTTKVKTEEKKDNFMDLAAGTLGDIFGENLDGKSKGKKLTFLEFLEKVDLPKDQKAEYKNWYYLHVKDLTEKQKDSLGSALEKKIKEAQKNNSTKKQ